MDALLDLASCVAYNLAKTPIWGINHVILVLIQIILYALDFLAFSVAVGWIVLDGFALLLDAGYDAVTMGTSAVPAIVAALCTTLSLPKEFEFAGPVRKIPKTAAVYALYVTFSTVDIVENFFTVVALIFNAIIIARALPLAIQTFKSCFSSAIAPARYAKWRIRAKRNVLAFGFPILAICGLVAHLSEIGATLTERGIAGGALGSEPLAFDKLTGTLLGSDGVNSSRDVLINYTHMNLWFEAGMGPLSIQRLLLDKAFN